MDIIRKYAQQSNKVKYISEKDSGIYDAMNKGIRMADGLIIGIVNSDDYYERDALENINRAFNNNELEIVYGMIRKITAEGRVKSVDFYHHDFMAENMINHPACFVTKAVYDKYGDYSVMYKSSSDYEFMLRVWKTDVVFNPIYKIISNFTVGGTSGRDASHLETFKIQKEHGFMTKRKYYLLLLKYKLLNFIRRLS
jgi:glycosyltransferase involved in cell wall biosynthesis